MGFNIFGLEIRWYGVMITTGIVAAFVIASLIFKKLRYKEDIPFEMLLAIIPIGIICSRLWYVIIESVPISQAFDFWRGGLTIHGAILGGAFGLWIYTRFIKKSSFFALADVLVIVLILAQAIGRWGNFFNTELYGFEINNPAFHFFPVAVSVYGKYHLALFFYESILNLVGFFILLNIFMRRKKIGTTSAVYLIYYGVVRAILEPLRMDPYIMRLGSLPASVLVSLLAIGVGIALLILNKYGKIAQDDDAYIDKSAKSKLDAPQNDEGATKNKKRAEQTSDGIQTAAKEEIAVLDTKGDFSEHSEDVGITGKDSESIEEVIAITEKSNLKKEDKPKKSTKSTVKTKIKATSKTAKSKSGTKSTSKKTPQKK